MVDLSDRAKLRLRGADRVRFLNGQVSNDVRRVSSERSTYACVMTAKGKMCADVFISSAPDGDAPGYLSLDAEPCLREALIARLERYLVADDVQIEDVTESLALLHLLPAEIRADDSPGGDPLASAGRLLGLEQARLVRSHRFGREGLDMEFPSADLPGALERLSGSYALQDGAAADALRIAAGVPKWGAELDENTIPVEAGLEARAIDYNKGCYVGQEVISRLKSIGHVNRALRRLIPVGGACPAAGMILYPAAGDPTGGAHSPKEAARVTSASSNPYPSPGATRFVALGYVRRGWQDSGTRLVAGDASSAGSPQEFEVAPE